jgi:hypothetical protein
MRLVLVGADFEENLGLCMVAAGAESRGHRTRVVPFQTSAERAQVVAEIMTGGPDVVGLAAQFQHRGSDFLALARDLRRAGFRGHITAGGQFATMAHPNILGGRYGIDSVVLYLGEHTIGDLLDALATGSSLDDVAGLALPDGLGARRTAPRPLAASLDDLPLAHRYRQHSRQPGVPFIPVSGGRGCWAACSFWQAQGQVEGEGAEVSWTPSSDEDQLDVAVRTVDGVAVTLLRLEQVRGRKHA